MTQTSHSLRCMITNTLLISTTFIMRSRRRNFQLLLRIQHHYRRRIIMKRTNKKIIRRLYNKSNKQEAAETHTTAKRKSLIYLKRIKVWIRCFPLKSSTNRVQWNSRTKSFKFWIAVILKMTKARKRNKIIIVRI